MYWSRATLAAASLLVCTAQVALADCDPVKILIQDRYKLTEDNRNVYVQDKEHDDIKSDKKALDTTYMGYGYSNLNYNSAFNQALRDKFHLDYRNSQQRWEAYTHLSDNARDAFTDCLKASEENIFILPDPTTDVASTNVLLNVRIRNYIPQKTLIAMPAHFEYDQGPTKPGKLPKEKANQTLFPGSTEVFSLTRDPSLPLTFTAKVGTQSAAFVIPPQDVFELKREIRFSKDITRYGHPCDDCHDTHQICIELAGDDDAVLIPGTEQFVAIKNKQDGLLHVMSPDGYTPKKVCMKGAQNVGKNNAGLDFCGYLTAEVYVKVPRNQKQSAKAGPPAYYGDPKTCN